MPHLFKSGSLKTFITLQPYLGNILEPLIKTLHRIENILQNVHISDNYTQHKLLNDLTQLSIQVATVGEVLHSHPLTFPLVEHGHSTSFKTYQEFFNNIVCVLKKPHQYSKFHKYYNISYLMYSFMFILSQIIWFHGRVSTDMQYIEPLIRILWKLYTIKPVKTNKNFNSKKIVLGNCDRLAYSLSIIHKLLLYCETNGYKGTSDITSVIKQRFSKWILNDTTEVERVDIITYNVLLNPLRITEFNTVYDPDLLIDQLIDTLGRMINDYPNFKILVLQEVNDIFDINTRKKLKDALINGTNLHNITFSDNNDNITSGTFSASSLELIKTNFESIVYPDLFTLPKSGDAILLKDILFHGIKDTITNNDYIMTKYQTNCGNFIYVINVHYMSGEDYNNAFKRKYQMKKVLNYVNTFSHDAPLVIIGDYNQCPEDTLKMLIELNFPQQYIKSLNTINEKLKFETFKSKRIDYCIYNAKALKLVETERCKNYTYISDHYPIRFSFEFI